MVRKEEIRYFIRRNRIQISLLFLGLILSTIFIIIAVIFPSVITISAASAVTAISVAYAIMRIIVLFDIHVEIYKLLSRYGIDADRGRIEVEVKSMLEKYKLSYDLPDRVNIRWQLADDHVDLTENDETVLLLDETSSMDTNLVLAALDYAQNCVVPQSRGNIEDYVDKSLNYYIAEDILTKSEKENATDVLYEITNQEYDGLERETLNQTAVVNRQT